MAANFNKTSYSEILQGLKEAQTWLNDKGINTENTRLSKILNIVEIITEHFETETIDQLTSKYKKDVIFYALTDADNFVAIYQSFKDHKSHIIRRSLLKTMVNGPLLPWEEEPIDGSTAGRNSLFELESAAILNIPDVEIVGFDDVDFIYDGTKFNVQCKRLYSPKQITANIQKAAKQFRTKANKCTGLKGIIALSIDKLVGLEESTITADNYNEVSQLLGKLNYNFIEKHKSNCFQFLDIDILGVLIFVHAIAEIQQPYQLLSSCREVAFWGIPRMGAMEIANYLLTKNLATALQAGFF